MADKLKQGVAVLTTFVAGETPTGAKLNSITAQLRNASQQLETAVGDIHDQSYPYSSSTSARLSPAYGRLSEATPVTGASTRSLDIANVARLIGPASNLNPEFLSGSRSITESVPAGVTEFSLNFPPASVAGVSFSANGVGDAFETLAPTSTAINASGDYFVTPSGSVYTTLATDAFAPGTVTYTVDPEAWGGGSNYLGARFNVLPDLNQMSASGGGCTIGAPDASGRRAVVLPTVTHQQFDGDMFTAALGSADPNFGEQLKLPLVITESYSVGEVLPSGFLLLKNWTTGKAYESAEYTYNGETSVLVGLVDITTEVDRGDQFVIVTVGTDITTSIDDLRRKSRHAHDRSFGEPLVPASSIGDWTAGPWGSEGGFTVSTVAGNYAPQYLHRYGYQATEAGWNDGNCMRGDLIMGQAGASPGGYIGLVNPTYGIYFGSIWGPRVSGDSNELLLTAPGGPVTVTGTGGVDLVSGTGTDVTASGGFTIRRSIVDPYVSSATVLDNVQLLIARGATTGNADMTNSTIGAEGLVAGPVAPPYGSDGLAVWSIDENGSTSSTSNGSGPQHYATTQNTGAPDSAAWVTPAFQVIHLSQKDVTFQPYDTANILNISTGANTDHWRASFTLPNYLSNRFNSSLGGTAILGAMALVRSPHENAKWYSNGGLSSISGNGVIVQINNDSSTASNNKLVLRISARGSTTNNMNPFERSLFASTALAAVDAAIDVKITLFVASPTLASEGIVA